MVAAVLKILAISLNSERKVFDLRMLWNQKISSSDPLTHFWPMFYLCRNRVVGFHKQNVWKTPVEEWYFQ